MRTVAAAAVPGFALLTATPDVPKIGILKIMPNVVVKGSVFPITWVIFNNGDTNSSTVDFHFVQPAGTTFSSVNYTTAYNTRTIVDGGPNILCSSWTSARTGSLRKRNPKLSAAPSSLSQTA